MTSTLRKVRAYFVFIAVFMLFALYMVYKWHFPGKAFKLPLNDTVLFNLHTREFFAVQSMLTQSGKNFETLLNQSKKNYNENDAIRAILHMPADNGPGAGHNWSQIKLKGFTSKDVDTETYGRPKSIHSVTSDWLGLQEQTIPVIELTSSPALDTSVFSELNVLPTIPKSDRDFENGRNYERDFKVTRKLIDNIRSKLTETENKIKTNKIKFNKTKSKIDEPLKHGDIKVNGDRRLRFGHLRHHDFVYPSRHGVGVTEGVRADSCVACFQTDFEELINNRDLCKGGDVELFIAIESTWDKHWARTSIRKTWGEVCNKPDSKIRCAFFFGNRHIPEANKILLQESETYHDIVQYNFYDTYANLTYKTISALKWSTKFCSKAPYIMKTDDDMYINTELLPYLLKAAPNESFIGGHCWGASSPHRELSSKWYVSFKQYTHSTFPAMCSGTGYIMSRDLVEGITELSVNIPFFHLEDVYVAICVKRLGARPVLLNGFRNQAVDFDPCRYRNFQFTSHGYQGSALESVWRESRNCPFQIRSPEQVYSGKQF